MSGDKISSAVEARTAGLNRKGRPKGAINKTTKAAKDAIAEVFERMGGADALLTWGQANPDDFYKVIWPKIIPLQIGSDPDNPLPSGFDVRLITRPPNDTAAG